MNMLVCKLFLFILPWFPYGQLQYIHHRYSSNVYVSNVYAHEHHAYHKVRCISNTCVILTLSFYMNLVRMVRINECLECLNICNFNDRTFHQI